MQSHIETFTYSARENGLNLGASAVEMLAPRYLPIDAELTKYCANGCDSFGKSIHCPPHVEGPAALKTVLAEYVLCLVFKIDIPAHHLLDERRYPVMMTIHHLAVSIERFAIDNGFSKSRGFACGSCQRLFCTHHQICPALKNNTRCLFPDKVRPSISGFGINVFELAEKLDWPIERILTESDPNEISTGILCGLVLVG